eukprot:144656-Rhodomonas_salina.3
MIQSLQLPASRCSDSFTPGGRASRRETHIEHPPALWCDPFLFRWTDGASQNLTPSYQRFRQSTAL